MRHERIHKRALFIDEFVDAYKKVRNRTTFPHREVGRIVHFLFPGCSYTGRGAFKTVHKVSSRARDLVLKTTNPKNIRKDKQAYMRLPPTKRNRYFAKIYWVTKYCLLQKYGKKLERIPERDLKKLKVVAKEYGLSDVRPGNIRKIDGRFKIVDALTRRFERRRGRGRRPRVT